MGRPPSWAPTYEFAKFPPKLHEIERIWTRRGRPKFYYVDQPLVDLLGDSGVNRDPLKEKRYKTDYFSLVYSYNASKTAEFTIVFEKRNPAKLNFAGPLLISGSLYCKNDFVVHPIFKVNTVFVIVNGMSWCLVWDLYVNYIHGQKCTLF